VINNLLLTPEKRKAAAKKGVATRKRNKEVRDKKLEEGLIYRNGLKEKISAMEARLEILNAQEIMGELACSLTDKRLLREEEISEKSTQWNLQSGVYFLIAGKRVVYVGQSVCVLSRIHTHSSGEIEFDRFAYVSCQVDKLDYLESLYIHFLQPPANGNHTHYGKRAPLSLTELMFINRDIGK